MAADEYIVQAHWFFSELHQCDKLKVEKKICHFSFFFLMHMFRRQTWWKRKLAFSFFSLPHELDFCVPTASWGWKVNPSNHVIWSRYLTFFPTAEKTVKQDLGLQINFSAKKGSVHSARVTFTSPSSLPPHYLISILLIHSLSLISWKFLQSFNAAD